MNRRLLQFSLVAAVTLSGIAGVTTASAELPTCSVPQLSAPAFSSREENHLEWIQPTGELQGGGYVLEVATQNVIDPDDGAFDFTVLREAIPLGPNQRFVDIEGLPEEKLHYHIRVKGSSACTTPIDPWSQVVSTTQDHTGPEVSITTAAGAVFALEDVVISGTAEDLPGPEVTTASGATRARVTIDNTTPALGPFFENPERQTVDVQEDGTWSATFTGVPAGTYRVRVTAFDAVGNGSSDEAVISIIVVNPS